MLEQVRHLCDLKDMYGYLHKITKKTQIISSIIISSLQNIWTGEQTLHLFIDKILLHNHSILYINKGIRQQNNV